MTRDEALRLRRLADRAETLMLDADFREILKILKENAIRQWTETTFDQLGAREAAWYDLMAAGRLEQVLTGLPQIWRLQAKKDGNE